MESNPDKVQQQQRQKKKPVCLIAAACNDMGIGKNGSMPWDLPAEFQYYRSTVSRVSRPGNMNLMVWGKLCWFSQPKTMFPLANTLHVVLSSSMSTIPDHAHFLCKDFDAAVRMVSEPPLADMVETVWVVGGTQVYKEALGHPWCDLLYLTDIMAKFDCDVFFPDFDREVFKLQERFPHVPSDIQEENGIKYKFQVFKKEIGDTV